MTPLQMAPFKTLSLGSFFARPARVLARWRAGLSVGRLSRKPIPGYFLMPKAAYCSGM